MFPSKGCGLGEGGRVLRAEWFHWEKEAERVMVEWVEAGALGGVVYFYFI